MIDRLLTVTTFIAVEDRELSDIHLNDTQQMQQTVSLSGEGSTETTHLFTGLGNETSVALYMSTHSLNSGDIRIDGHIQLNRGEGYSWQEVVGETLFSVFIPKERTLSRTLSIAYEGLKENFATLLVNFRNQALNESTTSSIIVRRTLSTIAVCGFVERNSFRLTKLKVLPIEKQQIDSQQHSSIYQGVVFAMDDYEADLELTALVLANGQIQVDGIMRQSKRMNDIEKKTIGQRKFSMLVQRDRSMSRTVAFDLNHHEMNSMLLMLGLQNSVV